MVCGRMEDRALAKRTDSASHGNLWRYPTETHWIQAEMPDPSASRDALHTSSNLSDRRTPGYVGPPRTLNPTPLASTESERVWCRSGPVHCSHRRLEAKDAEATV